MICSICLSDRHVPASCPLRRRLRDRIIALAAIVFIVCGYAWGHSWYDPDCCGGHDCEPVQAVAYEPAPAKAGVASEANKLPVMVVTTSLGTKAVTPDTKIRESKDGRMHGCIFQGRLICLYMPPGI